MTVMEHCEVSLPGMLDQSVTFELVSVQSVFNTP